MGCLSERLLVALVPETRFVIGRSEIIIAHEGYLISRSLRLTAVAREHGSRLLPFDGSGSRSIRV